MSQTTTRANRIPTPAAGTDPVTGAPLGLSCDPNRCAARIDLLEARLRCVEQDHPEALRELFDRLNAILAEQKEILTTHGAQLARLVRHDEEKEDLWRHVIKTVISWLIPIVLAGIAYFALVGSGYTVTKGAAAPHAQDKTL